MYCKLDNRFVCYLKIWIARFYGEENDDFLMSLDRYIVTNKSLECITGYVDKVEMLRKREELLERKVEPFTIC